MREKTAQEVYDELSAEGEYRITSVNHDLARKILKTAVEDADYINFLLKEPKINWRIVYTLYYDVLGELCNALIMLDGVKVSNHQGCFAYVCVKFPGLEMDWSFFERVRTTRNRNKYEGKDIPKQDWKDIEVQMKLYVSLIRKELERKLNQL